MIYSSLLEILLQIYRHVIVASKNKYENQKDFYRFGEAAYANYVRETLCILCTMDSSG